MDVNKLAALTFSFEGPPFLAYKMFPGDIILQVHVAASLAFLLPKVIVIGWKKYKQAGAIFSSLDMAKFCARESFWQFESAKSDLHCHHSALTDAFSQPTFGLVKEGKPQVWPITLTRAQFY